MTLATRTISAQACTIPIAVAEDWKPNLAQVQSVDQALQILPAYIRYQRGTRDERIRAGINQFVRDRFFHDYSLLSAQENWIAVLSSFVWIDLGIPTLHDPNCGHGLRLTAQMNAATLVITAARATSKGDREQAWDDSEAPNVSYLFPIYDRNFPTVDWNPQSSAL